MATSVLYNLQNVSYFYQCSKAALTSVNLQVFAGERLLLLGPNGSGKSTLQKILAGLVFAASGTVTVFDQQIDQQSLGDPVFAAAFRRKVGFVFQNSDVQLFCTNVLDEIMFGPLAAGVDCVTAEKQAKELLEYAGISHLAAFSPHHLSGGEKKKVAIAAILAVNPDVLIFDEPTNGLDPRSQRWMIDTINQLNRQGKTIIIATHCLELIPELADRAVVLGENHQIIASGSPEEILMNHELLLKANLIDPRYHIHLHGANHHVHLERNE